MDSCCQEYALGSTALSGFLGTWPCLLVANPLLRELAPLGRPLLADLAVDHLVELLAQVDLAQGARAQAVAELQRLPELARGLGAEVGARLARELDWGLAAVAEAQSDAAQADVDLAQARVDLAQAGDLADLGRQVSEMGTGIRSVRSRSNRGRSRTFIGSPLRLYLMLLAEL